LQNLRRYKKDRTHFYEPDIPLVESSKKPNSFLLLFSKKADFLP